MIPYLENLYTNLSSSSGYLVETISQGFASTTEQTQVKQSQPLLPGVIRKLYVFWWPQLKQKLITSSKFAHCHK